MQDLKLNPDQPSYAVTEDITDKSAKPAKKRSGCGCFLIGCFTLLLLIFVPLIGGVAYIYSLGEEDYGALAVKFITMPEFVEGIREGIQDSSEMTTEDKKAFLEAYDKLLANYGSLSESDKASIDRNVGIILRKAIEDPNAMEKAPPPEVMELLKILGFGDAGIMPQGTSLDSPQVEPQTVPQAPPATQSPSGDPYDFNLPTEPAGGTPPAEPASDYDF